MGLLIAIVFAKIGAKRVIGGFDSFIFCMLIWPVGIYFVLNSRRLDDRVSDEYLKAK